MFGEKTAKIIIVERGALLDEEAMRDAFYMSDTSPLWRALVQIIEQYKIESESGASAASGANNPLGMAAAVGAMDALNELLADLSERRKKAQNG